MLYEVITGFVVLVSALVAIVLYTAGDVGTIEGAIRDSLFQVVSLITTTGYATADYLVWFPTLSIVMFMLMFRNNFV